MDKYDLPSKEIPPVLYRVQYSESATTYDADGGLQALDINTLYNVDSLHGFRDALEQHLKWDKRYISIFISLFSTRRHAENWMLERHSRFRSKNCSLLKINMAELRDCYVFRAEELIDALSLSVPEAAKESIAKEYLVVHYIPPIAITGRHTIHDIERGRISLSC